MENHVHGVKHNKEVKEALLTLELYTQQDDDRPVYLSGTFNNWNSRDEKYRLQSLGNGYYIFHFKNGLLPDGPLEYKYLKGGWDAEELDDDGMPPGNRRMEVPRGKVRDVVPKWKQHADWYNSRYYPDIQVLSTRFNVPQLRRRRRVSVLLPWDYHHNARRYPVLYLQDGQNLFEEDAPFGTWGVDKQMAVLAERGQGNFIVVAIDHGGKERIKEYLPKASRKWGEALGREYASFLRDTLKPYIDHNFRTLPEREHTGIGGSSMGGLISLFTGIVYPNVYSKFMIFSPSLWAAPDIQEASRRLLEYHPTSVYLYVGGREANFMVTQTETWYKGIKQYGAHLNGSFSVRYAVNPDAEHNEAAWGFEFPKAANWLFG